VTPLKRDAMKQPRFDDCLAIPGSRLTVAEPSAATVAYWPHPEIRQSA